MRKYLEPRSRIEIQLPEALKNQLDIFCVDPVRGKPDYGKRSELVQTLLRDFFAKLQEQSNARSTLPDSADNPSGPDGSGFRPHA